MRYLAALTALGLIASTAAYAQSSQGNNQASSSSQAEKSSQPEKQTGSTQVLSHPFIRQIQIRLRQQGNYNGEPTGTYDEQTAKAVQAYQQQHNMQPTGQIDGPTIVALLMRPTGQRQGKGTQANEAQGNEMQGNEAQANEEQANETAGEGSSTPMAEQGQARQRMVVVPLMRVYERGYQQGFEQGLRWSQQQDQQQ